MSDKVLKVSVISPGNINTIESFEAGLLWTVLVSDNKFQ